MHAINKLNKQLRAERKYLEAYNQVYREAGKPIPSQLPRPHVVTPDEAPIHRAAMAAGERAYRAELQRASR